MKLNRKWILVMSLVLSLAIATGSTLAYMTATTDKLSNTFTLGNVSISLTEPSWKASEANLYPGTPVAKDPTITNTGKTPAWVWMKVEIPADVYPYIKLNTIDTAAWSVVEDEANGVMTILYKTTLAANGTATPFTAVELAADADLDDIESFNMDITAYAIQDKPFTNVDEAYAAFQADLSIETENAEELMGALAEGKNATANSAAYNVVSSENPVTLDAQGATVTLNGTASEETYHGYFGWVADSVNVSNLEITGSGFVEMGDYYHQGGNNVASNLVIENLASTLANGDKNYTLACAFVQYGTGTLNNCTVKGTTAIVEGAMPVDLGCVNGTSTTIIGGEYGVVYCWNHATVVVDDADIDTLYASPVNGTVTIKAGTTIDNIIVDYGTGKVTQARLAKLVIEDGATVNTITHNGISYNLTQWPTYVATLPAN